MLSVEEYLERVLGLASLLPSEATPVGEGRGRVLTEDLTARVAVPPFDNSAMDGFAVRAEDALAGRSLRVVGDIKHDDGPARQHLEAPRQFDPAQTLANVFHRHRQAQMHCIEGRQSACRIGQLPVAAVALVA